MEAILFKQVLAISGGSSAVITLAFCFIIFKLMFATFKLEISDKYATKKSIGIRLDKIDEKLENIKGTVDRLQGKLNGKR